MDHSGPTKCSIVNIHIHMRHICYGDIRLVKRSQQNKGEVNLLQPNPGRNVNWYIQLWHLGIEEYFVSQKKLLMSSSLMIMFQTDFAHARRALFGILCIFIFLWVRLGRTFTQNWYMYSVIPFLQWAQFRQECIHVG